MKAEDTIENMLKAIESFSIYLKNALEQKKYRESSELFYKLRRQNYYLYRKAKREKYHHIVQGSRKISAQLGMIRKNLNRYPKGCVVYVGMIIELSKNKEMIDEEYREKLEQLKNWGYEQQRSPAIPIRYHPLFVTELLIEHWDETERMAKSSGMYVHQVFDDFLWAVEEVLNKATLQLFFSSLPVVVKTQGEYSGPVFRGFKKFNKYLGDTKAWHCMVESITIFRKEGMLRLLACLNSASHLFIDEDSFTVVLSLLNNFGKRNSWKALYLPILGKAKTIQEFQDTLKYFEDLSSNKKYWTVQGLISMGYLCVHVTNAEITTSRYEFKRDPFKNIAFDMLTTAEHDSIPLIVQQLRRLGININPKKLIEFNPSASIISPKITSSLFTLRGKDFSGLVGIVFDYGYIYESRVTDAATIIVGQGRKTYRTSLNKGSLDEPAMVANYSVKGRYNEVLLRSWTVSSLFYTNKSQDDPGCPQWVIDRLKQLSDTLSFHNYLNGRHIYRTINIGTLKYVEKVFPVYEVDRERRTWKIIYEPKKIQYKAAA